MINDLCMIGALRTTTPIGGDTISLFTLHFSLFTLHSKRFSSPDERNAEYPYHDDNFQ